MNKHQEKADTMKIVRVNYHNHVLVDHDRYMKVANPNYEKTGMALCGILSKGETLESFKDDYIKRKSN